MKILKKVINQVYGLVSNKDFVRHGGTQEQVIDAKDAEFFWSLLLFQLYI